MPSEYAARVTPTPGTALCFHEVVAMSGNPRPSIEEAKAIMRGGLGEYELALVTGFCAPLYWAVRGVGGHVRSRNGTAFFLDAEQDLSVLRRVMLCRAGGNPRNVKMLGLCGSVEELVVRLFYIGIRGSLMKIGTSTLPRSKSRKLM